ncbi:MAG: hypothetical protein MUO27_00705, partial [Sedimentisphaerales bacterium]|nr:hypothetical protein [Sedimentisphaerales bacterium]
MKIRAKTVSIIVLCVIILTLVLWVVLYSLGGYLLKTGIETAGTKALGVPVEVGDVQLSILKGTIGITGLVVKNPPGYTNKELLILGQGVIIADVRTLLSDVVHIRELKLDDVNLTIEQKMLSNNLQDVIGSLKSGKGEGKEPSGRKLRIDTLEISGVRIKVKLLPVPGGADTVTLNLAPIRMKNLGGDNKLDTEMLAGKIMLAMAEGVAEQGVGVLPAQ